MYTISDRDAIRESTLRSHLENQDRSVFTSFGTSLLPSHSSNLFYPSHSC